MNMAVADLAVVPVGGASGAGDVPARMPGQYLTFLAARETYAMSIGRIKEIIEFGQVTAVPLMPAFIRGVINLRGAVVPVIDLSARLGFAPSEIQRRTCVVIVEIDHEGQCFDMGLMVDGVSEVLELGMGDLEPPPNFGARIRSDFIQCMARIRGRFVIVMRIEQVLSVEEVSELARMGGDPGSALAGGTA